MQSARGSWPATKLQVSREIHRQRYTRTTRSPSWRICPGGSYQHRRALNRPTTLCTRFDDDGDLIVVAVAEPVKRHVESSQKITKIPVVKRDVAVFPVGDVGGKPTREHHIRARSQRLERLQFPALAPLTASICAFCGPFVLTYQSKNHRVSFHL